MPTSCDYLIVGAGAFGCSLAERIAAELDASVIVIDKRAHIGGNCFSEIDAETGIEIHRYGTHIFHTSSRKVWDYLARFTEFNGYHHQVLTRHQGRVFQMPINLETINAFYGADFDPSQARAFIAAEIAKEGITEPRNLEEKAIASVGRPLYEALIRGYTIKQWRKDPRELPPDIITRLPVRFDYCEDYFNDARWQGIPLDGYTAIFEKMLRSKRICVELNCDYFEHRGDFFVRKKTIFTGPVDRLYDYLHGRLEWRSVAFRRKVVSVGDFQGAAVMNYADLDVEHTRIHEPRHLHPERSYRRDATVIFYETSCDNPDDPAYPVNTPHNRERAERYRALADKEKNLIVGGRLGSYVYADMDKTILAALECFETRIVPDHA